jgi:hypothetical protein
LACAACNSSISLPSFCTQQYKLKQQQQQQWRRQQQQQSEKRRSTFGWLPRADRPRKQHSITSGVCCMPPLLAAVGCANCKAANLQHAGMYYAQPDCNDECS